MSSPRKFSEKIALINKKQAEETAAFEAVMREVSATTRAALEKQQHQPRQLQQQQQHLTQPNNVVYRGGSLPNVSQMANSNSIDLQSALECLEDMKHGLVDKFPRDRNRHSHLQSQRRQIPQEKRVDYSPYGLTYLSPPPDTSWRRTNSDSAIHSSSMGMSQPIQQQKQRQQQASPPSPTSPVNRQYMSSNDMLKANDLLELENMSQCCVNAHDIQGISPYSSPLDDSGIHLPVSSNTDSLPDLTNLQFTSSLGTLMDRNDQVYLPGGHPGGMTLGSLQCGGHIGPVRTNQQSASGTRNRKGHVPLALYGSGSSHSGLHGTQNQESNLEAKWNNIKIDCTSSCCHLAHHPSGSSCHHSIQTPTHIWHDSRHANNMLRCQPPKITISEVTGNGLVHHSCLDGYNMPFDNCNCNRTNLNEDLMDELEPSSVNQSEHIIETSGNGHLYYKESALPLAPVDSSGLQLRDSHHCQLYSRIDFKEPRTSHSQGLSSLLRYRNSTECPQSPTSPLSQHSYSPSESPVLPNPALSSSPFTDIYNLQHHQQQQQQQSILQQQFEQFTMLHDSPSPQGNNNTRGLYMQQQQQQHYIGMGPHFGNMSPVPSKAQSMEFNPQLQQQMMPDIYYHHLSSQASSFPIHQYALQASPASLCHLPPPSPTRLHLNMSKLSNQSKGGSKIPDIILTGVDDNLSHQDFTKDVLSGLTVSCDVELFSLDEALKIGLNPLEFEELQMLTNPNAITDPATEDSFRLDNV